MGPTVHLGALPVRPQDQTHPFLLATRVHSARKDSVLTRQTKASDSLVYPVQRVTLLTIAPGNVFRAAKIPTTRTLVQLLARPAHQTIHHQQGQTTPTRAPHATQGLQLIHTAQQMVAMCNANLVLPQDREQHPLLGGSAHRALQVFSQICYLQAAMANLVKHARMAKLF